MKQKVLCILIIILAICIVVLSLLTIFNGLIIPGLIPFLTVLVLGGLLQINRINYRKCGFKKPIWIGLVIAVCFGAISNIILGILQIIDCF
ncbi:hypothetical protein RBG61_09545 [Paludicola sp. MB14-C6]|uniref:hypothetical protein n=1 Tax=Paludihabitans sp. MB14-C6 TaxID=3070656 RepID=UPI0027DDD066|nr:hypothetical protein [Paludicola sp. MB14-C6]WMJ22231.1 hypothetical protein RBG61_09545 [Paludicola sp. MB14-C6]